MMHEAGVLHPSPIPYSSLVIFVKKTFGNFHLCVDYHKLNDVMKANMYEVARIENSLGWLFLVSKFATLDFMSWYWQINLREDGIVELAFACLEEVFELTQMPFRLNNTSATLQKAFDLLIICSPGREEVLIYLNDLIVFALTI